MHKEISSGNTCASMLSSKVLEIGINHPCIIIVLVTNTKEMPK